MTRAIKLLDVYGDDIFAAAVSEVVRAVYATPRPSPSPATICAANAVVRFPSPCRCPLTSRTATSLSHYLERYDRDDY